jgi:hypothetical protein
LVGQSFEENRSIQEGNKAMVQRAALADLADKRRPTLKSVQETAPSMETAARTMTAYDEAMARMSAEVAEPDGWWNLFAIGPLQIFGVPGPLPPHQVIKVGETAFIGTVIVLNPFLTLAPGLTPLSVLSNFALPYEVRYQTGNLTTWTLGPGALNVVHSGAGLNLIPGQAFYVDILGFTANTPGLYEMNISGRILGAAPPFINAPQFAGYARQVVDLDADTLFFGSSIPAPGFQFDQPIRFQVYP